MGLFEWSPIYEVGVREIDAQHKQLMGFVNEMFDALMSNTGADAVGDVLDRLVAYTEMHFGFEEQLMERGEAKGLDEHKAAHRRLLAQVLQLRERHSAGDDHVDEQAIDLLREWLVNHILHDDTLRAAEVRRGMKAASTDSTL